MIIEQIWAASAYRNFNYLIACGETADALAIDPLTDSKSNATTRRREHRSTS